MKTKKLLSFILSLVFVISMAIIPNGISASAEADIEKPVIDISTLTVSTKNATVGDTVRFSIKITDNVKVKRATIYLKSPITQKTVYLSLKYDISSDRYIGDFAITNTVEEGTWNISYIYATDGSDNSVYCYNRKCFSGVSNPDLSSYSFTVTDTNADTIKPVIDISTLTVSTKNATVGDTVRFSIKITDNVKVKRATIYLKSPITQKTVYLSLKYDISSDRYIGDFAITNTVEEGTWNISYIYATDGSDNSVYCYNRKCFSGVSNPDLSSYSFTVAGANTDTDADIDNPTEETCDFEVALGETLNLSYSANCDIYWMSSDTSIAKIGDTSKSVISFGSYKKVSSSCEIIPVKEGIVTIYASDSNGYALNSAKVKVKKSETVTPEEPSKDSICGQTMIINNSTTISNQTINKDLYIPKNVTLTLSGNVTVNGNIYIFGTLNNNGSLTVNGTLNCLRYGTMMSAGSYNYGYFNSNGSVNIDTLNVRDNYLDYKISHDYDDWTITLSPTETSTGLKKHICKNCGYTETEIIPKLDTSSIMLGDVNGDKRINSNDALAVLRYSVDQITLTDAQLTAGDVNKDGKLNSNDALIILQFSVGRITEF